MLNRLSTGAFSLVYKHAVKPFIFSQTPDRAHGEMLDLASVAGRITPLMWLLRQMIDYTDPILETRVMGVSFANPFGLSAGLDKDGTISACLDNAGFGFETVGSITHRPAPGNPRPWFHRLPERKSLIIHAGLPSIGSERAIRNAEKAYTASRTMRLSISLARTNDTLCGDDEEGIQDYLASFRQAVGRSNMLEINISCPNTMVGERFEIPENLDRLLAALDTVARPQPVLVKMPHDKTWPEFRDLLDVICEHNVQGVTIANLRTDRTGLDIPKSWEGGLSGALARPGAESLIEKTYREYGSKLVIAGVGGTTTPEDAYWKIRHGASLVMLISALMFEGPQQITTIKRGVAALLRRDGFSHVSDAVGVDVD